MLNCLPHPYLETIGKMYKSNLRKMKTASFAKQHILFYGSHPFLTNSIEAKIRSMIVTIATYT